MSKTTLIIPCYNEAARVQLDHYQDLLNDGDIQLLFVNDGSRDGTGALLDVWCQARAARARTLHFPRNKGKAEAVRQGLLAALQTDAVIVGYTDADEATPLSEIVRLIHHLQVVPDHVRAVFGSRIRRMGARIERQPFRHYAGRAFATCVSLLLEMPIYDTQCGAKLFRADAILRAAIQTPFLSRWIFDVELIGRLRNGYQRLPGLADERFMEIPLDVWRDVKGSKVKMRTFARALIDLCRIARELRATRNA